MDRLICDVASHQSRPTDPNGKGSSYCLRYQRALAFFFQAIGASGGDPWWLLVTDAVPGHQESCLTQLFGFDQEMTLGLLCQAGLVSFSTWHSVHTINSAGWEQFITVHGLRDIMEVPNKTRVDGKRYYFINIGRSDLLKHTPIDQFSMRTKQVPVDPTGTVFFSRTKR